MPALKPVRERLVKLLARPAKKTPGWRPSGPWITARKSVQAIALAGFLALFVFSRRGGWPAALVNLPMRLDPLAALASLISSRTLLAGSSIALVVVLLTLITGRAWCGWLCPLGTVLDYFSLSRPDPRLVKNPPQAWRTVKYILLFLILAAALFGNLTLLIFDPLTILIRTLTASLWPGLDAATSAVEMALYHLPFLAAPVSALDAWLRPVILPGEPVYYQVAWLYAAFLAGWVALNYFTPRFWCRYLCPLGGLLGLTSKLALFRRQVGEECKGCTLCTAACPTGTIDPARGYASDPSECTMCMDCLEACPRSGIRFVSSFKPAEWQPYDPGRRQALVAIVAAAGGVALLQSDALIKRDPPHLLRPPGGRENNLLDKCVRCGECLRACPTSALQPALFEAGLNGLWTPLVVPRLGYCDYACNACGQICPEGAIPALTVDEKRQQVIGKAYIDKNRCLAWSDGKPCIVCEEMCPLPEKAVQLQESQVKGEDGQPRPLQLPVVLRERCIGCGICEYKCPVNGQAAIQVWAPGTEVPF